MGLLGIGGALVLAAGLLTLVQDCCRARSLPGEIDLLFPGIEASEDARGTGTSRASRSERGSNSLKFSVNQSRVQSASMATTAAGTAAAVAASS